MSAIGELANSTGGLPVNQGTLMAGEDLVAGAPIGRMVVEQRNSNTVISTATTTTIKTGSGYLNNIVVTGGTTGTIVIYDNTAASSTQLANFDTTNALATYTFNCSFATGCTIVTSAATKISVSYR